MIILLGPDHTGKTTLAKKLEEEFNLRYFHYTKDSTYEDYLKPMCNLEWTNAVLDRHIICEYAYSYVMRRKFAYTDKQWHNILLSTLIQRPIIILCCHRPDESVYEQDQYLPLDNWDMCLSKYDEFLNNNHIPFIRYDYDIQLDLHSLIEQQDAEVSCGWWWRPLWRNGWGCTGSCHPKVLLVAERIGPNNINGIPFETGPTGQMLTDLLTVTGTPLGDFAVTNYIKDKRHSTREPNKADEALFSMEIEGLEPKKIVFMGSVSKKGARIVKEYGVDYIEVPHFGYYAHQGSRSVTPYIHSWRKLFYPETSIEL
jgi:hypothetical protein